MLFKQRLHIACAFTLLFSIFLSACEPASQQVVNRIDSDPPAGQTPIGEAPTATLVPAPPLEEYTNQDFGFNLSIPTGYEVLYTYIHTVFFLAPQGTSGHRQRAWLNVELAGDLTAEWIAKQAQAENSNLGTVITSAVMTVDGEKAYVLSHLPGQDLNRQVFVVHEGFLYRFTFVPDNPQEGESYRQMETLFSAIIQSMRFLHERLETPPIISKSLMAYHLEQALEARRENEISGMLGNEFTLLYWTAPGISGEVYGRDDAARVVLEKYLPQSSDLDFQLEAGWPDAIGSPEVFFSFFPGKAILPVLVKGWGPQGHDEAVVIFSSRSDGSLFWQGVLVTEGHFMP
jgi:hypothetical protein